MDKEKNDDNTSNEVEDKVVVPEATEDGKADDQPDESVNDSVVAVEDTAEKVDDTNSNNTNDNTDESQEPESSNAPSFNSQIEKELNDANDTPPAPVDSTGVKPVKIWEKYLTKKYLRIAIPIAAIVLLAGAATAWWLMGQKTDRTANSTNIPADVKQQPKLDLSITVADGTVEYLHGKDWKPLKVDSKVKLAEKDSVRTAADSRAVLTLDDGSVVRLDANTSIKLTSLAANDVKIEQITGSVYSRVVASDRKYTINIDDASYRAIGTAFVTYKSKTENGVKVIQSSVKASSVKDAVAEGKQYYKLNGNADLQDKITDINIDELVENAFMSWNIAEDKKDAKFAKKLGILPNIEKRAEEIAAAKKAEAERIAAEEAARKAAEEAARIAAEEAARIAVQATVTATVTNGVVSWTYPGTAADGFKVVYSRSNTTPPTFDHKDSDSVYVSDPKATTYDLSKMLSRGKTYYIRVCVYQPENKSEPCAHYSSILTYKKPWF